MTIPDTIFGRRLFGGSQVFGVVSGGTPLTSNGGGGINLAHGLTLLDGKIGINRLTPAGYLDVRPVLDGSASSVRAVQIQVNATPAANSAAAFFAASTQVITNTAFNYTGSLFGVSFLAGHGGAGSLTNLFGLNGAAQNFGGGAVNLAVGAEIAVSQTTNGASSIATAYAGRFQIRNTISGGVITTSHGIQVTAPSNSGTMTSYSGLTVADFTGATNNTLLLLGTTTIPSGNYAIHSVSTQNSYLNGNVNIGTTTFPTSATLALTMANGTAPSASVTNSFQMYSADQTAGNAAPHFRTESGQVIKLYQQSHIADPSGGGTQDAEARTAINSILAALENAGLLATS